MLNRFLKSLFCHHINDLFIGNMFEVIFCLLTVALIVISIIYGVKYAKKLKRYQFESYMGFARKIKMTAVKWGSNVQHDPGLTGIWNGHRLRIYQNMSGGTIHNKSPQVNIEFLDSKLELDFEISKQDGLSKLGKSLGFISVEFEDAELNNTFNFKSNDQEKFKQLMTVSLRDQLMNNRDIFSGRIRSKEGKLTYRTSGWYMYDKNSDRLKREELYAKLESVVQYMDSMLTEFKSH